MKHYGIAQWVDFARGLTPDQEGVVMREHLAAGCLKCRQVRDFCDKLARICLVLAPYRAPEAAVRNARAIFPIRWPDRPTRAVRIPIDLIYDSFLVPAPAGMRASWQVGWQALYRAGDCSLDLRIEPELQSSRAAVIGQISNHTLPGTEMANIPVCLRSGRLVVAETLSNRFGEFQMEYEQQGRLQLCVYLDGGARCIQVPVKKLVADKHVGRDRVNVGAASGRKRAGVDQQ
ncbi:MAG: hypothetical protein ABSH44_14500 [Bryobacteraceae bacterium]|jgi:hypothetical protein